MKSTQYIGTNKRFRSFNTVIHMRFRRKMYNKIHLIFKQFPHLSAIRQIDAHKPVAGMVFDFLYVERISRISERIGVDYLYMLFPIQEIPNVMAADKTGSS